MSDKPASLLHYSIAFGIAGQVRRPANARLAVQAKTVSTFAASLVPAKGFAPIAQHPGFGYRIAYFGDSAEIQVGHVDIVGPVVHAAVAWGARRDAERAFGRIMGLYLGYIAGDPEGLRFAAEHSPVMPEAEVFLCELATPDFGDLDMAAPDKKALREFIRTLAFNIIEEAPTHRQVALAMGDPMGEYPDFITFGKKE